MLMPSHAALSRNSKESGFCAEEEKLEGILQRAGSEDGFSAAFKGLRLWNAQFMSPRVHCKPQGAWKKILPRRVYIVTDTSTLFPLPFANTTATTKTKMMTTTVIIIIIIIINITIITVVTMASMVTTATSTWYAGHVLAAATAAAVDDDDDDDEEEDDDDDYEDNDVDVIS